MNYEQINILDKKIFLVDMRNEKNKFFSELTQKGIGKYIKQNKKIAIIVNKKGYSSGIICESCGFIPKCDNCDVSIAYHKDQGGNLFGICHICKKYYLFENSCKNCGSFDTVTYGIGTEQIASTILEKYNKSSLIIESDSANSKNKIKKILENKNKYNIFIGTSILSNPIKGIVFDLIIFINADIGLNIPDFQSNYNNFIFIYETINKHKTQNFIIQSFKPENPSIKYACKLDRKNYQLIESKYRKEFGYPPFGELCLILYKNEIEDKVFSTTNKLYQELLFLKEQNGLENIEIYPTPPLIYKIFGKYRYNIIIKGKNIRKLIEITYEKLNINQRGFKIDRNPQNLI